MSSEQKSTQVPWQGLLALVVAAVGTIFYLAPLDTSRPVERTGVSLKLTRPQDVDARLWQDPLVSAQAHEGQVQTIDPAKHLEELQKENERHCLLALKQQITEAANKEFWVLPVLVPGGSYAEYGETRLRMRRAVLEALGTNGISPVDGEHLGYVKGPWKVPSEPPWTDQVPSEIASLLKHSCLPDDFIVPYEWCKPIFAGEGRAARLPAGKVLVLWLRDEEFQQTPLTTLSQLLKALDISPQKTTVKVIGPRSSTGLLGLIDEARAGMAPAAFLEGVTIFSPTASASEELLHEEGEGKSDLSKEPATVEQWLKTTAPGLKFYRTTTTDDEICRSLILELGRRGVRLDPKEAPQHYRRGNDHVALISEWDTFYGRALPLTFAGQASHHPLSELLHSYPDNIHPFQYLRGVDGMLPGAPQKELPSKSPNASEKNDRPRETPEGLDQADYLRRLAAQLQEMHQQFHREGGLKAVGVLGSDVYDKLLVLKALRRALPGVLFFTNNLDARLGHPDEWNSARNLIVASPFGLSLRSRWGKAGDGVELQGKVLPFRDSYQTAVYTAALCASSDKVAELVAEHRSSLGEPRLFEIARSGPFELPHDVNAPKHPTDMHPDFTTQWWNLPRSAMALGMGVFIAGLIAWVNLVLIAKPDNTPIVPSTPPPTEAKGSSSKAGHTDAGLCSPDLRVEKEVSVVSSWPIFGIGALLAWLCIAFIALCQPADGEPFAWATGISIWPTEVIRLLAIFMAAFFFWKIHRSLQANQKEIEEEFKLAKPPQRKRTKSQSWWNDRIRRLTLLHWRVQDPRTRKIMAQNLWNEYIWSGEGWRRIQRIAPLLFCYLGAASLLMLFLGLPAVPYRGNYSRIADIMILVLAVLSSTAITFYVADATILNRRLIHYITVDDTDWPEATFEECRKRRKLELEPNKKVPPDELLCDYLEIELIAKRTETVSGLIYYPFVVLFLMIVSRLGLFDNWDWPVSLILVLLFNGSYAAWSAFRLRNSAEEARKKALQRLSNFLIAYTAAGHGDGSEASTIREMAAAIRAEDRGAFAAISHHPILGAILLPSGGLGIWALSQYLPKFFE